MKIKMTLLAALIVAACGDNIRATDDPVVDVETPDVDLPDVADPTPDDELTPDAGVGDPDGVLTDAMVDAGVPGPDACIGAYPNGDSTGHDTHPDHNHCH